MRRLILCLVVAGCGEGSGAPDASVHGDLGVADSGVVLDGAPLLRGAFTVQGCATLDVAMGAVRCSGRSPLSLVFVPLGSGVDTFVWTFDGGRPASSKAITPAVDYAAPGTYTVTLAAGGSAGTTSASGQVIVTSGGTGSPCLSDGDCDANASLSCICKGGDPSCVGALAVGFCSRGCAGACGASELCVDFGRGAMPSNDPDAGTVSSWRRPLCLPSCASAADCRAGFSCRDLPTVSAGGVSGDPYRWKRGCFADVLGDDGDSCIAPGGTRDPSRCLSGRCDGMGARDLCTSPCTTTSDCPSSASCASFNDAALGQVCLRRCDMNFSCAADPLLDCEAAGGGGSFGFMITPAEPATAKYCAPARCSMPSQCGSSGLCSDMGFCARGGG